MTVTSRKKLNGATHGRLVSEIEFGEFVEAIDQLNRRGVDFLISYDGKCGDRTYGEELPKELGLQKVLLKAGLSSQSILLGKKEVTYEALYISQGLQQHVPQTVPIQYSLFDTVGV